MPPIKQHRDGVQKGFIERSVVTEHVWHSISWDKVDILDYWYKEFKEVLHIRNILTSDEVEVSHICNSLNYNHHLHCHSS